MMEIVVDLERCETCDFAHIIDATLPISNLMAAVRVRCNRTGNTFFLNEQDHRAPKWCPLHKGPVTVRAKKEGE